MALSQRIAQPLRIKLVISSVMHSLEYTLQSQNSLGKWLTLYLLWNPCQKTVNTNSFHLTWLF